MSEKTPVKTCPVTDWATDYDIFDPVYVRDPKPIWDELRESCPIAHSDRWGGSWLPTKYEDLQAMVRMVSELSSSEPIVVPPPPELVELVGEAGLKSPPITSDPPEQIAYRRLILPLFSPKAVAKYREFAVELCHQLIDQFAGRGHCDAAQEYAQQIPPRLIAHFIGVDPERSDDFVEWVRGVLEIGLANPQVRIKYRAIIREYFGGLVKERKEKPEDDFISDLLRQEINGEPVPDEMAVGMCNLLLVAGIDTTWSSIGSALFHLGTHREDRERLVREPELFPSAIEELLRFYAPVTMARKVTQEVTMRGVTFKPGDKVLLNFPAANHDPEAFDRADEVVLDRQRNRHIAFGVGIHRCAGSNLARMEMDVALRTWFERIPEFEVSDVDQVTWAGGQVRGPRELPMRFACPA
jgi:cytochrome P450